MGGETYGVGVNAESVRVPEGGVWLARFLTKPSELEAVQQYIKTNSLPVCRLKGLRGSGAGPDMLVTFSISGGLPKARSLREDTRKLRCNVKDN